MPFEAPMSDPPLAELLGLGATTMNDLPPPCPPAGYDEKDMSAHDSSASAAGSSRSPAETAFVVAETRELRTEVDRLRADRDRLLDTQRRIMELLGTSNAERLVHDLRNVLNERELYRALADVPEDEG